MGFSDRLPGEGIIAQEAAFTAAVASAEAIARQGNTPIITYEGGALHFSQDDTLDGYYLVSKLIGSQT
jgi:hypothetical protein